MPSLSPNRVKTFRFKIALVILAFIIVLAVGLVVKQLTKKVEYNVPVPGSWKLIHQEGKIASTCLGSGSECGLIIRTYETNQSEAQILQDLQKSVHQTNWSFHPGSNGGLSKATLDNQIDSLHASVEIADRTVKITLVKQSFLINCISPHIKKLFALV